MPIRILARLQENDERTVMGRTLSRLCQMCNTDRSRITARIVKDKLCYRPVPEGEEWRISVAKEIIKSRDSTIEIPGFSSDEKDQILDYVCVT